MTRSALSRWTLPMVLMLGLAAGCPAPAATPCEQVSIPVIDKLPNMPTPYAMRDWKKTARDFDALTFDLNRKGQFLPLAVIDTRKVNYDFDSFGIPSYIGSLSGPDGYEGIPALGALVSASYADIDKRTTPGNKNWVRMAENYFSRANGLNLYLNNLPGIVGDSFWYQLFPSLLFCQLYACYPDMPDFQSQFFTTADVWRDATVKMGGSANSTPDFNHTFFHFKKGVTVSNGRWLEGDAAGAVAWIEYLAYVKSGDKKYLAAAQWSMDYLQPLKKNPYYEVLMPYGAAAAARMNAELGTNYDVAKLVNWCFDGSNPRGWGMTTGRWGAYDCGGLIGSAKFDEHSYAFAMNTFAPAAPLVPVARYDARFARAIGKWMLHAANNARLFYPNALPANQQTDKDWADRYDPEFCMAYEGLRNKRTENLRITGDYKTIQGSIRKGNFEDTMYTNGKCEVLAEASAGGASRLEHVWEMEVLPMSKNVLHMVGDIEGNSNATFAVSYGPTPQGPFRDAFTLSAKRRSNAAELKLDKTGGKVYLKIKSENSGAPATIAVDDIWVSCTADVSPYATGDAKLSGWAKTNLGVYGSAFAGVFGGIVQTTNVPGILQLDCLVTDSFHAAAYPTYLLYNPHAAARSVRVSVGEKPCDLYDAVAHKFVARGVSKEAALPVAADSAVLLVICPADAKITHKANQRLADGVVIDYSAPAP